MDCNRRVGVDRRCGGDDGGAAVRLFGEHNCSADRQLHAGDTTVQSAGVPTIYPSAWPAGQKVRGKPGVKSGGE